MPTPRTRRANNRYATAVAILTLVGAAMCALAVAGLLLYRYFELRPWLYHPGLFGVPGCVALAVACGLGISRPALKWPAVVLCVLAAVAVGFIGWFTAAFSGEPVVQARYESPDHTLELVVHNGRGYLADHPTWELRLRTKSGLMSREADLGCVNADMVGPARIGWIAPRTVRIGLSGGAVDISVDGDGRPDHTVDGRC